MPKQTVSANLKPREKETKSQTCKRILTPIKTKRRKPRAARPSSTGWEPGGAYAFMTRSIFRSTHSCAAGYATAPAWSNGDGRHDHLTSEKQSRLSRQSVASYKDEELLA